MSQDPATIFMSMTGSGDSILGGNPDDVIIDADDLMDVEAEDTEQDVAADERTLNLDSGRTADELKRFVQGQISFDQLASTIASDDETEDTEMSDEEESLRTLSMSKNRKRKSNKTTATPAKRRPRGRNKRCKLDATEECILGEANMKFITGHTDEATTLLFELIREKPMAHEPYNDLADMFDQMGQTEKALQYYYLAAHLCPNDGGYWYNVGEKHDEQKKYETAVKCYSKAIKFLSDREKILYCKIHKSRNCEEMYNECEDDKLKPALLKAAVLSYEDVIADFHFNPGLQEHAGIVEELVPKAAKLYYENNDLKSAIRILEDNFLKFDKLIDINNVNMYFELLMLEKLYSKTLFMFHRHCGVELTLNNEKFETEKLLDQDFVGQNCNCLEARPTTADFQIDLRSKLVICLIHLNCLSSVEALQAVLLEECDPEEVGDLFMAIAESYMEHSLFRNAEPFLRKAVGAETFGSDPEYWLRFARCLKQLSQEEESIEAFKKVVTLSPTDCEARLELSKLLLSLGRQDEAIEFATQSINQDDTCQIEDGSDQKINLDLMLVRCQVLYEQKNYVEFAKVAKVLLLCDMIYVRSPAEMGCMISSSTTRTRIDNLKGVRKDLTKEVTLQRDRYSGKIPSSEQLFDIWIKLCRVLLIELRDIHELERVVFSAFTCPSFSGNEQQLEYVALMCLYKAARKESNILYSLVKSIIMKNPQNNQAWNIFSPVMSRVYQDLRHNRFCLRLFPKHPDLLPLSYFNGQNALMSGSYKHALADYLDLVKKRPNDALPAFLASLAFAHLACQKYITNKNSVVIQMVAFLEKYVQLRGECQESLFNFGRAFHTIGLLQNAAHFYKKALQCPIAVSTTEAVEWFK